jgi:hypothetical protein
MAGTVDLREVRESAAGDLDGLAGFAQQLVGQPFLFARPSYGDELTLHFGQLREPTSAKVKRPRGSFVLTLRGSVWQIDPGAGSNLVLSDTLTGTPLDLSALESHPPVTAGSLTVAVRPFADPESGGFGLYLAFSDQSRVVIRPDVSDLITEADPDLPRLADWELFTPHDRVLRVGPGANWSYTPLK